MTALQTTPWTVIEQDIKTLEQTGSWPNCIQPAWAKETAEKLFCYSTNPAVALAGLKEIIAQLKLQLEVKATIEVSNKILDKPDSVG